MSASQNISVISGTSETYFALNVTQEEQYFLRQYKPLWFGSSIDHRCVELWAGHLHQMQANVEVVTKLGRIQKAILTTVEVV